MPNGSADVTKEALPLTKCLLPSVVDPFENLTVPTAVPEYAETTAVSVTACPMIEGLGDAESVVLVNIWVPALISTPRGPAGPHEEEQSLPTTTSGHLSPFRCDTVTVSGYCPPEL